MRLRHPDGADRAPVLLHQRARRRGPRRHPRPAGHVRRAGPRAARRRRARASACGWPHRPPPGWPRDAGRAAPAARARCDARGLEVVTLNGFPYAAFQQPVVKHAVYQPDWTDPRRLRVHPRPGPRAGRPAARRRRARLDLDAAAGLARAVGRRPVRRLPPRAWTPSPRGLAPAATAPVRVAFEPEPGCVIETTDAGRRAAVATWTPSRLGVCLDLAHLACALGGAGRRPSAALRAAGVPIVKTQVSAALAATTRRATRTCSAAYVEPRFLHQTRGRDGLSTDDLDEALALRRARRRGGCTTTCRCTPPRSPPLRATTDVLRRRAAASCSADPSRAATTSTSRRTPGTCCRRSCARTTPGRAGRRHRRRAGLRPRPADRRPGEARWR